MPLIIVPCDMFLAKNEFLKITRRNMLKVKVSSTIQGSYTLQRTALVNVLSEFRENQYNPRIDKYAVTY